MELMFLILKKRRDENGEHTMIHPIVPINRVWAMPNKNTFSIKPIGVLIGRHIYGKSIDPFANSNRLATTTNDLDPDFDTDHHLDALDFLKLFEDESIDVVLFDPPYSPRQVSECCKGLDKAVNMQTTQASFWGNMKKEIALSEKKRDLAILNGLLKKYYPTMTFDLTQSYFKN